MNITEITPVHPAWPTNLNDLDNTPDRLWVAGDLNALTAPAVTITGARASTKYGTHVTSEFAHGIAEAGFVIVAGLGYGIDAAAHRAALAVGRPTIAYLASGVDRPSPSGHTELLRSIVAKGGAVISEVEPSATPSRSRSLNRSRLLAAHSDRTLIVEAGSRSGALNVAWWADALGRGLAAVPGPITSAVSAGVHALIANGTARLVDRPQTFLEGSEDPAGQPSGATRG